MPTFTAICRLSDKARANTLSEAMENLTPEPTGVGVAETKDGSGVFEVCGYFIEPPDKTGLSVLAQAFSSDEFDVEQLPETDWVAHVRAELAPITAGRFFLYGSHDADKVPENSVALMVDAALAFGTGHHGTTQGCLIALDRMAANGFVAKTSVDIGCGTAVLAMAAARIWPDTTVLASDIDVIAVETAIANLEFNDLEGCVACYTCPGFDHPALAKAAPYDLIFANILKLPLIELAPDMAHNIATNGQIILSGLLNTQADDVIAAYKAVGFTLGEHDKIGEWSTLTLLKQAN